MLIKDLNKENLHHAYLIEGNSKETLPEMLQFLETLEIKTKGNADFFNLQFDSLKMEDALNLKSLSSEKSFEPGKKIFLISANNFLLEAQNAMLKIFEEPIPHTHFFLIVPDIGSLLGTLISRFQIIEHKIKLLDETKEAEKFLSFSLKERIDYLKEFLIEEDDTEEEDVNSKNYDSPRAKSLRFLNALEKVLEEKFIQIYVKENEKKLFSTCMNHILEVRSYLRQPGSSLKTLLESVALIIPPNVK